MAASLRLIDTLGAYAEQLVEIRNYELGIRNYAQPATMSSGVNKMERTFIADLHNHTTASDGEYTPTELIHKAAELGLEAIGVTDHDTLNGLDEALAAGAAVGLRVVPGAVSYTHLDVYKRQLWKKRRYESD